MTIDFNNAPLQSEIIVGPWSSPYRAEEIKAALNARAAEFVRELLPLAYFHKNGRAAQIGDIYGSPGFSMKIELTGPKVGTWYDHATGQGGGLIQLFALIFNMATEGPDFPRTLQAIQEQFLGGSVAAWSMPVRDKLLERSRINASKPKPPVDEGLPPPSETYPYYGLDGKLIALVHRIEFDELDDKGKKKKIFLPWCVLTHKAEAPIPRPLYHLPQLAASAYIVFVEGERKVDWLTNRGITATCVMGGAPPGLDCPRCQDMM